jgi:probable selenium-dependent hydroxylase accessory protein YqeC
VSAELLALFGAERGLVCAVGAGGKKSTLYRLAAVHPGRLALTATVTITTLPPDLGLTVAVAPPEAVAERARALAGERRIAFAAPHARPERLAGLPAALVAALHRETAREITLVKADGARMRWLKAPKAGEPVLPPGTETAIVLTSARSLGEPLTERVAHRLERVLAVTGARAGDVVTPALLARLYTAPGGLLDGLAAPRIIPTINMVDDDVRRAAAREAARAILESTTAVPRVILACMQRPGDPVVEVVER